MILQRSVRLSGDVEFQKLRLFKRCNRCRYPLRHVVKKKKEKKKGGKNNVSLDYYRRTRKYCYKKTNVSSIPAGAKLTIRIGVKRLTDKKKKKNRI